MSPTLSGMQGPPELRGLCEAGKTRAMVSIDAVDSTVSIHSTNSKEPMGSIVSIEFSDAMHSMECMDLIQCMHLMHSMEIKDGINPRGSMIPMDSMDPTES